MGNGEWGMGNGDWGLGIGGMGKGEEGGEEEKEDLTISDRSQHISNSSPVLRVEIGVDFIKEVEGRWIALLDCEDEGEGAETCK